MFALITLVFILININCQVVIPVRDPNNIIIDFGSCLNTFDESSDIDQSMRSIIQSQPDLWMWLGDAIYLDGESFFFGALPGPGYDVNDGAYVQNTFNSLKNRPVYVELKNNTQVIGTWDDHDYAYDNANETFEFKQRNMGFYLDFVDEPLDSPRRSQQGIYTSYYVGDDKLIKVILLDVRYNRDSEPTASSLLETDTTEAFDDMLGEEQWAWLDGQLADTNGTYTLLVSGTQYLPDDRPIVPNWFENSKDRLLDMIKAHQKSGVVLLSGDVHYAEMIRHPCPARVGYTNLYEFTSSGLTHSATFADIFDGIIPDTYSREEDRFFEKNFGVLRFTRPAESTDPPNLVFEARDIEGNVVLTREVPYSDLIFDQVRADGYTGCEATDSESDDNDDTSSEVVSTVEDIVGDNNNNVDVGNVVDDILGDSNEDVDVGDVVSDIFNKNK